MRSGTVIVAGFLLAFSFAAPAANLRYSFVGTGGTVTVNAPSLNAQQEALFIDWLWEFYAPVDTTPDSPTLGQKLTRNAANEAQAYRNWAAADWNGTRASIVRWKHELDKAAVAAPVVPKE